MLFLLGITPLLHDHRINTLIAGEFRFVVVRMVLAMPFSRSAAS